MTSRRTNIGLRSYRSATVTMAALSFLLCLGLSTTSWANARNLTGWAASWTSSPHLQFAAQVPLDPGVPSQLSEQTVRQVVRVSLGGSRVRIVVSNAYGTLPLAIGAARVARSREGAAIVPGSDRVVTFGGSTSIVVPPGAPAISDPVRIDVAELDQLSVSLYFPGPTPVETVHWTALQTTYIAEGDRSAAATFTPSAALTARLFLSGVLVEAPRGARTVVAFGDSITDGFGATVDANRRWPDVLAARLRSRNVGVINAGISGNQLLGAALGDNALARFERDALSQPGVESAIVLIGINDIGGLVEASPAYANTLIAGYRQLIAQAHARGVRILGGTLVPFEGALEGTPAEGYYTPEKEQVRQAVNAWIRTSGEFDAVVDFDLALRDPSRPTRLLPAYDSGDHLHPSDAGYRAMALTVDAGALFGRR